MSRKAVLLEVLPVFWSNLKLSASSGSISKKEPTHTSDLTHSLAISRVMVRQERTFRNLFYISWVVLRLQNVENLFFILDRGKYGLLALRMCSLKDLKHKQVSIKWFLPWRRDLLEILKHFSAESALHVGFADGGKVDYNLHFVTLVSKLRSNVIHRFYFIFSNLVEKARLQWSLVFCWVKITAK